MGLKYPEDLEEWSRWASSRNRFRVAARTLKSYVSKNAPENDTTLAVFTLCGNTKPPQLLIALESTSPTVLAALLVPGERAQDQNLSVAIVAEKKMEDFLRERGFEKIEEFFPHLSKIPHELKDIQQVIAAGHYMTAGSWAYKQSKELGWGFNVVQHGLNTPFAPPLPAHSTLFAFSQEDAEFWISGREDIKSHVVGSQIFYEALQKSRVDFSEIEETPLFLGQMHGAELPRFSFAQAAFRFCRNHGAIYRPHPAEKDKLSTITHKLWEKWGIKIDRSNTPLNEQNNPVVSVFSTGVLEAAIRGIPAWVYHPNPPAWLIEFWDRYGMNQWGSEPTPAPAAPDIEPAVHIARIIAKQLEN